MSFMKDIFGVFLLGLFTQRNEVDLASNQSILAILLMVLTLNGQVQEDSCKIEKLENRVYRDYDACHYNRYDNYCRFDEPIPFAGYRAGQFK